MIVALALLSSIITSNASALSGIKTSNISSSIRPIKKGDIFFIKVKITNNSHKTIIYNPYDLNVKMSKVNSIPPLCTAIILKLSQRGVVQVHTQSLKAIFAGPVIAHLNFKHLVSKSKTFLILP